MITIEGVVKHCATVFKDIAPLSWLPGFNGFGFNKFNGVHPANR